MPILIGNKLDVLFLNSKIYESENLNSEFIRDENDFDKRLSELEYENISEYE